MVENSNSSPEENAGKKSQIIPDRCKLFIIEISFVFLFGFFVLLIYSLQVEFLFIILTALMIGCLFMIVNYYMVQKFNQLPRRNKNHVFNIFLLDLVVFAVIFVYFLNPSSIPALIYLLAFVPYGIIASTINFYHYMQLKRK